LLILPSLMICINAKEEAFARLQQLDWAENFFDPGTGDWQEQGEALGVGAAFAERPGGPYKKYKHTPILDKSHGVMIWKQGKGVACLASISSDTLEDLDHTSVAAVYTGYNVLLS
jgi:hypothetical protein